MNAIVTAGELRNAVKAVSPATSDRSPLAEWQNVYLRFGASSYAIATSGNVMAWHPIQCECSGDPFVVNISAESISQHLIGADDSDIATIAYIHNPGAFVARITVKGSRGPNIHSNVPVVPPKNEPEPVVLGDDDWFATIANATLHQAITCVGFVARKTNNGIATDAIQLTDEGDTYRFAAIDGNRVAILEVGKDGDPVSMDEEMILLPADMMRLVSSRVANAEGSTRIAVWKEKCIVSVDGTTFMTVMPSGRVPDYRKNMSTRRNQMVAAFDIIASDLANGLDQAKIVLDQKAYVVGVDMAPSQSGDRLAIQSSSPDRGAFRGSVSAEIVSDFAISIDPGQVWKALRALGDLPITFSVVGDLMGCIESQDPRYTLAFGSITKE